MQSVRRAAVLLAFLGLVAIVAPWGSRADAPPAPDPAVATLIGQLGLVESPTPVRDRPGWKPPKKILVWAVEPELMPLLESAAPGVELLAARDATEGTKLAPGADALIGFCTSEVLAAGASIRWIQSY